MSGVEAIVFLFFLSHLFAFLMVGGFVEDTNGLRSMFTNLCNGVLQSSGCSKSFACQCHKTITSLVSLQVV